MDIQPGKMGIFESLKKYWKADLLSGLLVSLIALPLCLGIAKASEFPAVMGVMTAVVGGMVVSLFAGSELTIKGPAAGLIVIVAGCVKEMGGNDLAAGWQLSVTVIMVAGLVQIVLGWFKVAKFLDFFPIAAVHGMLASIGFIIMSKQIHFVLGVKPELLKGKEPLELIAMIPESIGQLNSSILIIGLTSLLILFGWQYIPGKIFKKIPPALIVLIVGVVLGKLLNVDQETLKPLKPLVDPGKMEFKMQPDFAALNAEHIGTFFKYLILFVLIGSLESLLTGKAIDLIDPEGRKSNLSKDLSAVGFGNFISGLLGGLPMISEVARSTANLNNGAKSRWANFFHGVILLVFVLLLVPVIRMVPQASLSAMLIFVGFRLASPKEFIHMLHIGKEQLAVFVSTIIATLATDLLIGIAVGILVKFFIELSRGATLFSMFKLNIQERTNQSTPYYEISGVLVFTNYLKLSGWLSKKDLKSNLILDFSTCKLVDYTSLANLSKWKKDFETAGGSLEIFGLENHFAVSSHPHSAKILKS